MCQDITINKIFELLLTIFRDTNSRKFLRHAGRHKQKKIENFTNHIHGFPKHDDSSLTRSRSVYTIRIFSFMTDEKFYEVNNIRNFYTVRSLRFLLILIDFCNKVYYFIKYFY